MSVRGERTGRVLLAVGAPSATAKPRFQALGVLLSTIGTSLVVLTVIVTVGGGVLLTILGARVSSGNETAVALAIAAVFAGLMSVGTTTLTLLFATCFLMLGSNCVAAESVRARGYGAAFCRARHTSRSFAPSVLAGMRSGLSRWSRLRSCFCSCR